MDLVKVDLVAKSGFSESGFSLKAKAVMDLAQSGFSEVDLAQKSYRNFYCKHRIMGVKLSYGIRK